MSSFCTAEMWWQSPPQGPRWHYTLQERDSTALLIATGMAWIFIVAKQLVLTTVTHLMSWIEQFLTHQLSCCRRWVAGQLLRPSVMWDFGQPAGSLHPQTSAADVLHTGRNRPLLQNRFWFSSEQRSVHTHRWRGAACLKREFKFDPIVTDSSIWTETQMSQSFPSATGSISFTQEEQ